MRYPIRLREVEVLRTAALGTALLRLTLGGPGLAGPVVEVVDAGEEIPLPGPDGVEVRWVRREPGVPVGQGDALERALHAAPPVRRTFVWIACEAGCCGRCAFGGGVGVWPRGFDLFHDRHG